MERFFAQSRGVQTLEGGIDCGDSLADIGHQSRAVPSEILDPGLALAFDNRAGFQSLFEVGIRRDYDVDEAVAEQSGAANDEFRGGRKNHILPHLEFDRDSLHGRQHARVATNEADASAPEKKIRAGEQAAGVGEVNLQVVEFFQALTEPAEVDNEEGHDSEPGNDKKADFCFEARIAVIHGVQGSSCERPSTKSRITGSVEARNWSQVP